MVLEGDSFYLGSQACNYPYPEEKGIVRGKVFIGGFKVTKIDDNSCYVIYISDADLGGSIPGMIKNQVAKKQG